MISESYRLIEPSDLPSQLTIDDDLSMHDLEIDVNNGNSNFYFEIDPQHYPGEIPIGSDMIHVSGRDRKDVFEDDHLALPSSHGRPWTRLILLEPKEFREIKAYLPIKTFKLRKSIKIETF